MEESFMDSLFQEMLGASSMDIETNVDIVFVIDATESMQPLIDKVKSLTLSFREELEKGLKENRRIIKNLRIKVVVFRDYYVDDKYAMEESRFFILPDEKQDFYNWLKTEQKLSIYDSRRYMCAIKGVEDFASTRNYHSKNGI